MTAQTKCLWCPKTFAPVRRGGNPKKFCSTGCKNAFFAAARSYTLKTVEAGLLSVDELKRVSVQCTTAEAVTKGKAA